MVQETSLAAYYKALRGISRRQASVLEVFTREPDRTFTDQEISDELEWTINRITNRRGELAKMGYIIVAERRINKYGNMAQAWELADPFEKASEVHYVGDIAFIDHIIPKSEWVMMNMVLERQGYIYMGDKKWHLKPEKRTG